MDPKANTPTPPAQPVSPVMPQAPVNPVVQVPPVTPPVITLPPQQPPVAPEVESSRSVFTTSLYVLFFIMLALVLGIGLFIVFFSK